MALKITLASGQTHVIPFSTASTLTVSNLVQVQPGESYNDSQAWSEVTAVEVIPDPQPVIETPQDVPVVVTEPAPVAEPAPAVTDPVTDPVAEPAADTTLATPVDALQHALTLSTTQDAAAHIDAALAKWPDDPDLLAAKADLTDGQ